MREVTLDEVRQLASDSREAVWEAAAEYSREPKVYLHWTAGRYHQLFDEYHVLIEGDGNIRVSTDDFSEVLSHTWKRNSGGVAIALCCCLDAGTYSLEPYPPTQAQIERMAEVIAAVCDGLWLTIDIAHVMTHAEAADNEDGYTGAYDMDDCYGPKNGCERWDLEYLGTPESPSYNPYATDGTRGGDVLRGKAIWYRQRYRAEAVGKTLGGAT